MTAAGRPGEGPASLLGVTIRRSLTTGRAFLIYGTAMSLLLGLALNFSGGGQSFAAGFPLLVPIFASVAAQGALLVFTSDRLKGVLEYLMAYGVSPRRLFTNTLLAALALVSVVLAVGLGAGLGVYLARHHSFTQQLATEVGVYAIPMAIASVALSTTTGMFWTSISSPRSGMNSPVGLAPFIGILPSVVVLLTVAGIGVTGGSVSATDFLVTTAIAVGFVGVLVAGLLGFAGRLLRRERLLSPA